MGWGDVVEGTGGGILAGVAIAVTAPLVIPLLAVGARPLAKKVVKSYLAVSEKVQETIAESEEKWNDLVAEARAEREAERHGGVETQAPPQGEPAPQT